MWVFIIEATHVGSEEEFAAIGRVFADGDIAGQLNGGCTDSAATVGGLKGSCGYWVFAGIGVYNTAGIETTAGVIGCCKSKIITLRTAVGTKNQYGVYGEGQFWVVLANF